MIVALLFYGIVYGWVLLTRLQPTQVIQNTAQWVQFTVYSTIATVVVCGVITYDLLRAE